MSERPRVEDGYSTVLQAVRLMEGGNRADFDSGSNLLAGLGEEASPVLVLIARQLLTAVAVLTDRDPGYLLDRMALQNIEQAEGMSDDEQG